MKKWIKADNGRVTQVIEFDDGSKMELPLDNKRLLAYLGQQSIIVRNTMMRCKVL